MQKRPYIYIEQLELKLKEGLTMLFLVTSELKQLPPFPPLQLKEIMAEGWGLSETRKDFGTRDFCW